MLIAEIINNKACCPDCKQTLKEECTDVFLAEVQNSEERFFEFHRRCDKCKRMFKYYVDVEFNKRYTLKGELISRVVSSNNTKEEFTEEY